MDALKRTKKPSPPQQQSGDIVVLSDDEEPEDQQMEIDETELHSSLMRILEGRYSAVFDAVKMDIMSSHDEKSCALKIVVGKAFSAHSYIESKRFF